MRGESSVSDQWRHSDLIPDRSVILPLPSTVVWTLQSGQPPQQYRSRPVIGSLPAPPFPRQQNLTAYDEHEDFDEAQEMRHATRWI